ncbi:NUDIX hydrolase, partial [Streptomyces sp. NPDC059538]|uniref:NUDIX hydrolase n=1 Tax=Streptomyces sp. NPDC059538 TaxID=3346860 RepID=UPI0036843258
AARGRAARAPPGAPAPGGGRAGRALGRAAGGARGPAPPPVQVLGDRVHPQSGVHMTYVACHVVSGEASVVDEEDLAEVLWLEHGQIPEYVPWGLFDKVQAYLDEQLGA